MTETPDSLDGLDSEGPRPVYEGDPFLVAFGAQANEEDKFRLGLTFTLPGALCTGTVINPRAWLRALGEVKAEGEDTGYFSTVASLIAEGYTDGAPDALSYFYMQDLTYGLGNNLVPTNHGVLARVEIASISSWSLGVLGAG